MLPESLKGVWDPKRLREESHAAQAEVCVLLNRLQNAPIERIKEIKVLRKPEIMIVFGDDSEVILQDQKLAATFLTEYIRNREEYIGVLEFNRAGDPRITGEFNRLQRQLRRAVSYLRAIGQTNEAQDIEEMK